MNRQGINEYSKRFSAKVLQTTYDGKERATGDDLKNLTDIKQVNLLTVKGLFESWKKEAEQIKSPYFDYSADAVQEALQNFMNVLSRNISVKLDDLKPLLENAVEESILLIFSPFDFYAHLADQFGDSISHDSVKEISRYIKVNRNILEGVLSKLENTPDRQVTQEQYHNLLSEVLHEIDATPEDIEEYFEAFNKIESLTEVDIYGQAEPEQELVHDYTEQTEDELKEMEPSLEVESPDEQAEEAIDNPENPDTINDTFSEPQKSIADSHANDLESISGALSINQRFMFQNALFSGDEVLMSETLDKLDRFETKKQAIDFLYTEFPHWNIESEEFEELVELIHRKLD